MFADKSEADSFRNQWQYNKYDKCKKENIKIFSDIDYLPEKQNNKWRFHWWETEDSFNVLITRS